MGSKIQDTNDKEQTGSPNQEHNDEELKSHKLQENNDEEPQQVSKFKKSTTKGNSPYFRSASQDPNIVVNFQRRCISKSL